MALHLLRMAVKIESIAHLNKSRQSGYAKSREMVESFFTLLRATYPSAWTNSLMAVRSFG